MNDIKSFDFGHIQKCPFWPMPLHFRNASAASEPGTNWETLLRKIFVIFIFVLPMFRYVPASANGEIVFHQMFLNLVGNIFALRETTFVLH